MLVKFNNYCKGSKDDVLSFCPFTWHITMSLSGHRDIVLYIEELGLTGLLEELPHHELGIEEHQVLRSDSETETK